MAKLREYDEEVEIVEDTKLYQDRNLMSGVLGHLAKGTKINCKDFENPASNNHNLSIKNSLASLMSSTQSTSGGFNSTVRIQSANKSAGGRGSAVNAGNADQNWVEVYEARSNTVGYVLK